MPERVCVISLINAAFTTSILLYAEQREHLNIKNTYIRIQRSGIARTLALVHVVCIQRQRTLCVCGLL